MFKKILIANRGDIALRVLRTLKDLGIQSVAVHSEADAQAMHVRLAHESVCIGPGPSSQSYLNMPALIAAAELTHADGIHPGVGFLSENATFAHMVEEHGMTFIGPSPKHIHQMGHKVLAKETAKKLGLPLVPGSDGALTGETDVKHLVDCIGYPFLIKAANGGGGKGMRVVHKGDNFKKACEITQKEAMANFGSDEIYLERYLETPRHIEIQVLCDGQGGVLTLAERDCSIQRRHQKIWEEAPAPHMPRNIIETLCKKVQKAMRDMGYKGVGTLEFLFDQGEFYFIEMNTRIQVEHPITEAITGIDLIKEQIKVAAGERLTLKQEDIQLKGHAIECRINAEHPETFYPSPGKVTHYLPPGGPHVRVDSGLYTGYQVPPYYDSLVAKLIVHGDTREECLARLNRALEEYAISGIDTLLPLHRRLAKAKTVQQGTYHIHWLEEWLKTESQAA